MTHELFDLAKIRRNWERARASVPIAPLDRLAEVKPPLDPFAEGQRLLERLRREVVDEFPEREAALAPFVTRVEVGFERLRAETSGEPAAAPAGEVSARQQLMAALADLEDICETFLGLRR